MKDLEMRLGVAQLHKDVTFNQLLYSIEQNLPEAEMVGNWHARACEKHYNIQVEYMQTMLSKNVPVMSDAKKNELGYMDNPLTKLRENGL